MSKMGSHDPFGHLKHKLWPKEMPRVKLPRVKLAIWLPTTKSQESTWFPCVQVVYNIPLESSWHNFASDFISIKGLHTKLWGPKIVALKSWESQFWEFWDSHLGVPRQNAIWMWALWRGREYTIRGKVVVSPKSRPWWVLWIWVCPWFVLTPKVFKLCTYQLVVWFCVGSCGD